MTDPQLPEVRRAVRQAANRLAQDAPALTAGSGALRAGLAVRVAALRRAALTAWGASTSTVRHRRSGCWPRRPTARLGPLCFPGKPGSGALTGSLGQFETSTVRIRSRPGAEYGPGQVAVIRVVPVRTAVRTNRVSPA